MHAERDSGWIQESLGCSRRSWLRLSSCVLFPLWLRAGYSAWLSTSINEHTCCWMGSNSSKNKSIQPQSQPQAQAEQQPQAQQQSHAAGIEAFPWIYVSHSLHKNDVPKAERVANELSCLGYNLKTSATGTQEERTAFLQGATIVCVLLSPQYFKEKASLIEFEHIKANAVPTVWVAMETMSSIPRQLKEIKVTPTGDLSDEAQFNHSIKQLSQSLQQLSPSLHDPPLRPLEELDQLVAPLFMAAPDLVEKRIILRQLIAHSLADDGAEALVGLNVVPALVAGIGSAQDDIVIMSLMCLGNILTAIPELRDFQTCKLLSKLQTLLADSPKEKLIIEYTLALAELALPYEAAEMHSITSNIASMLAKSLNDVSLNLRCLRCLCVAAELCKSASGTQAAAVVLGSQRVRNSCQALIGQTSPDCALGEAAAQLAALIHELPSAQLVAPPR
eukprot:m.428878 g.428878  ORF g.428878 m.428878 type:complete len:447 (-) comp56710_c0_seq3:919-2259(-)